jgi:hypothetical protein
MYVCYVCMAVSGGSICVEMNGNTFSSNALLSADFEVSWCFDM